MAVVTETDWQAEAVRLRREDKMATKDIAERVGKSESQVRRVIAQERTAHFTGASSNGSGAHEPESEYGADHGPLGAMPGTVIPGQTMVEDHLAGDVPPEDDPEYEAPAREMDGGDVVSVSEVMVSGSTQLGLFDAGGRSPESASVRLAGGKIAIVHGEAFEKGTTIHFSGTAVITAVKQQDKRDAKTGQVVGCEQQHTALITDLTVG